MIPVTQNVLFDASLDCLSAHKSAVGKWFKGRFTQIFLALKFYQNDIPSMHSGRFISVEVIQILLDDLYAKASKPLEAAVLMLFESNFLARSGVSSSGKGPQNTWRNNLNIQKGIGCYAPANILAGAAFLNQSREECQFLASPTPGVFSGSSCSLCSTGSYRGEKHRKWLRIDPGRTGYAAIDSSAIFNFAPYVVPTGVRIPALPLIVALYHDAGMGLKLAERSTVGIRDFMVDFNFSLEEFQAYFDDSPENPLNARIIEAGGSFTYLRAADGAAETGTVAVQHPGQQAAQPAPVALPAIPLLPPAGTIVSAPQHNSGWDAQKCVAEALTLAGWTVHDVSRMQLGCDLLAKKSSRTILVEVKSSVATCAPVLTNREWAQAQAHKNNYVMAVVENFDAASSNTIFWVPNPATNCAANVLSTVTYSIARSVWFGSSVGLDAI
ncbi:protein NO VEIN domain-containing protein [Burkholderia thailandensis]|uniref:protein NO VEIN domain-containing protein n=1 Tax=Burkholderia thailandensis TaxID=57975 RepID=UPI0014077293|nr:DUF3883 domain-containing protein [Burkholderia thailandensis]MCS3398462.1 DUF3883 domain-containing protein [Burkholderia thailandensis]QIO10609.1 DUF3883 domain-containing protein [Burkholderia thailandensis]